jgi:hypothetical protein
MRKYFESIEQGTDNSASTMETVNHFKNGGKTCKAVRVGKILKTKAK